MSRARKPAGEKSQRHNLTFNPRIWRLVEKRATELGFSTLSSYLSDLVRRDASNFSPSSEAKSKGDRSEDDPPKKAA